MPVKSQGGLVTSKAAAAPMRENESPLFFKISLAEWSLNKRLFAREMDNLDFPGMARNIFGIEAVEYVNQFFQDKAEDTPYLNQLLARCRDNEVENVLIMVDNEGALADREEKDRLKAVENHFKWVNAAKYLGCKSIRVNTFGEGDRQEMHDAAVDALSRIGLYAAREGINVLVENHGGVTSDASWLASVIREVKLTNVGTLPDFGNFCIRREGGHVWEGKCIEEYDRYKGVAELMPFAKGVSAKAMDFDDRGECVETDYHRMLQIVKDAGFTGFIGIEYQGERLSEEDGIRKTKALLERVGGELAL